MAVLTYAYYKLSKNRYYWSERGVTNTGFKFFWGDDKDVFFSQMPFHEWCLRIYKSYPKEPYIGMWTMFGSPYLMIRNDFDLIRSIWIKDFDHFTIANSNTKSNKDVWPSNRNEKLMLNNVQSAQGDEWKNIRYQNLNKRRLFKGHKIT